MKRFIVLMVLVILSIDIYSMDKPLELVAAYSATIGKRFYMEDCAVMLPNWDGSRSFFAVYDGHSGVSAAHYSSQKLHENLKGVIEKQPQEKRDKLLCDVFAMTDSELEKEEITMSGTTAVVALLEDTNLHLAWAGDSRAVVIRNNRIICQTTDHTANNVVEKTRIQSQGFQVASAVLAGSTVSRFSPDGFIPTRALGNSGYVCKQKQAMISEPEVMSVAIQPNDLVLMGSDGLFDDLNHEQICEQVKAWHENKLTPVDQQTIESMKIKGIGNGQVRALTDKLTFCAIQACPPKVCCDNITALVVSIKEKAKAVSVAP